MPFPLAAALGAKLVAGLGGKAAIGSTIFSSILGGIGGSSKAKLEMKMAKENVALKGKEDRKTLDFTAQLDDFYKQKDKFRKRAALDTYGQFSLTKRYSPNMVPAPPVQVPNQPIAN